MKKSKAKQMAREIRGFVVGNQAEFAKVIHEYCIGMSDEDYYLIEDTYFEMEKAGEFDDITGIQ